MKGIIFVLLQLIISTQKNLILKVYAVAILTHLKISSLCHCVHNEFEASALQTNSICHFFMS